jgi:hypothetical protein
MYQIQKGLIIQKLDKETVIFDAAGNRVLIFLIIYLLIFGKKFILII